MSESTKLQPYKYSLRSTAIAPDFTPNGYLCNYKYYVMPVPPQDALTIENLYLHLKVRFNVGIASASRKILKIGVANERPTFVDDPAPSRLRTYDVNLTADANRYIETHLDLSALLDKDAVGYKGYFDFEDPTKQYTYIYFELPPELINTSVGDLIICRMDTLYTTLGIR